MDAILKISVDLTDHDIVSPDDQIVKGIAEFKPNIFKSAIKGIEGQYSKVAMRVTWNWCT